RALRRPRHIHRSARSGDISPPAQPPPLQAGAYHLRCGVIASAKIAGVRPVVSGTARLGLRSYLTTQRLGDATLAAGVVLSCFALFFIYINSPLGVLVSAGSRAGR